MAGETQRWTEIADFKISTTEPDPRPAPGAESSEPVGGQREGAILGRADGPAPGPEPSANVGVAPRGTRSPGHRPRRASQDEGHAGLPAGAPPGSGGRTAAATRFGASRVS